MSEKPFTVEGVDYTPEGIEDIRQQLIVLRDGAIKQSEFQWVVILSHAVALLAYLKELEEEQEKKENIR